jgi:hypothetical protein
VLDRCPDWCTEDDLERLRARRDTVEGKDQAIRCLRWLPEHASLIAAHSFPSSQPAGTVFLDALGLDEHELRLHSQNLGQSGAFDFLECSSG